MKYFPKSIALICLITTPLLYILTLTISEKYLNTKYYNQIENIYIGESQLLLEGAVRLEQQVASNIQKFVSQDWLINRLRLQIEIVVATKDGKIIYPIFTDLDAIEDNLYTEVDEQTTAENNFSLLNDGIELKVQILLNHGSLLGNIVLLFCSLVSLTVFLRFYRVGSLKAQLEQQEHIQLVSDLKSKDRVLKKDIDKLKNERQNLFDDIQSLNTKYRSEKDKAKLNEEELFDEIVDLEEKLNSYIELKRSKEDEIDSLKSKIEKYEKRKANKRKTNLYDFTNKRFTSLYKNIELHKRALDGFLSLNEEQQIKAEEIIASLDRQPDQVVVKRKVFVGKKHKSASFEVLFAYNGRLYFNKKDNKIVQILVVGTKNTQTKDMEYLHNL